jgi:hypothetical protein
MKSYESKVLQEDPEVWNPNRINFAKLNKAIKNRGEHKKVVREKYEKHKAEAIRAFEKNKKEPKAGSGNNFGSRRKIDNNSPTRI